MTDDNQRQDILLAIIRKVVHCSKPCYIYLWQFWSDLRHYFSRFFFRILSVLEKILFSSDKWENSTLFFIFDRENVHLFQVVKISSALQIKLQLVIHIFVLWSQKQRPAICWKSGGGITWALGRYFSCCGRNQIKLWADFIAARELPWMRTDGFSELTSKCRFCKRSGFLRAWINGAFVNYEILPPRFLTCDPLKKVVMVKEFCNLFLVW